MTADQPQRPEPRENWDWHTSDDQPQRPEPRTLEAIRQRRNILAASRGLGMFTADIVADIDALLVRAAERTWPSRDEFRRMTPAEVNDYLASVGLTNRVAEARAAERTEGLPTVERLAAVISHRKVQDAHGRPSLDNDTPESLAKYLLRALAADPPAPEAGE